MRQYEFESSTSSGPLPLDTGLLPLHDFKVQVLTPLHYCMSGNFHGCQWSPQPTAAASGVPVLLSSLCSTDGCFLFTLGKQRGCGGMLEHLLRCPRVLVCSASLHLMKSAFVQLL